MKSFASFAMLLLFICISAEGFSQTGTNSKPKQFNDFPDIINCTEAELNNVFSSAPGQDISLSFSDNFLFAGSVVNNVVKYSNLQTAVIKSPVFNNSIFSISKIINKDNTVSYLGRIINKNYFDGYELRRNEAGKYQLIKIETDKAIQDCSQL